MKEDMNLLRWVVSVWGLMLISGTIFALLGGDLGPGFVWSIPAYLCVVLIYVILKDRKP